MAVSVVHSDHDWNVNSNFDRFGSWLPSAGNIVVVGISGYSGSGVVSPADAEAYSSGWSNNVTWARAVATGDFAGTVGHCVAELWWAKITAAAVAAGSDTPRVGYHGAVSFWASVDFVLELAGIDANSPIGATGSATADGSSGGAANLSIGLSAAPASDSAVIAVCGSDFQFWNEVISGPAGFTTDHLEVPSGVGRFGEGAMAYQIGSAAQTNAFTFPSGGGNDLYGVAAEIKIAPPLRTLPLRPPVSGVAMQRAANW